MGLRQLLAPLRLLGAPVDEIALTVLLSLRFMVLVFDEMRNLSLGLAARAVPWKKLPPMAGIQVFYTFIYSHRLLMMQLNLYHIAREAMEGAWKAAVLQCPKSQQLSATMGGQA